MTEHKPVYEIGQHYWVPCLTIVQAVTYNGLRRGYRMAMPVHGPEHEDAAILHFPWQHYHIDTRFCSDQALRRYLPNGYRQTDGDLAQQVIHYPIRWPEPGEIVVRWHIEGQPKLRRRKCQRATPVMTLRQDVAEALALSMKGCRIDPGNPICPHRGFDLRGAPIENGQIVCPGHGLRWEIGTGELVQP